MSLLQFVMEMIWAVVSVEQKVDKRGKEFVSIRFDRYRQHHNLWVKTVALYKANKHGGITMLVNYGGVNKKTLQTFSASASIVTKLTNQTLPNGHLGVIHTTFKNGKFLGFVSQYNIAKFLGELQKQAQSCNHSEWILWDRNQRFDGNIDESRICELCGAMHMVQVSKSTIDTETF